MRFLFAGTLALLVSLPAVRAGDEPKDKDKDKKEPDKPKVEKKPADEFKELSEEFDSSFKDLNTKFRTAKDNDERKALRDKFQALVKKNQLDRIYELAEKNPKEEFAPDALAWVVDHAGYWRTGQAKAQKAMDKLAKDYADSRAVAKVLPQLAQSGEDGEKKIKAILAKNKTKEVQGVGTFELAQGIKNRAEELEGEAKDAAELNKEAEALLNKVVKEYGDVKLGDSTLKTMAEKDLFTLRNLTIGKAAPEIEGQDSDGKKFKLSDYRGKVVVLDFWAEW